MSLDMDALIIEAQDKIDLERADAILQHNRYQDRVVGFADAVAATLTRLAVVVWDVTVKKQSHWFFWTKKVAKKSKTPAYARKLGKNVVSLSHVAEYKIPVSDEFCLVLAFTHDYQCLLYQVTYDPHHSSRIDGPFNETSAALKVILPFVLREKISDALSDTDA